MVPEHHRKPLSPWLYIIVGAAVALYSFIIKSTSDAANPTAMRLFMYVGFIFVFIGIIRLLVTYFRSSKASSKEEQFAQKLTGVQPFVQKQASHRIIVCHRCQARNYSTSNFCHMCGQKL